MKNLLVYFVLTLIASILNSCNNGLFDAGNTIVKTVNINDEIDVLELESIFNVELLSDTANKVELICGENVMQYISVNYSERTLTLKQNIPANWSRNYERVNAKLHLKYLPRMNIREPVNLFTNDTFTTDFFAAIIWSKMAEINVCINSKSATLHTSFDDFGVYKICGKTETADFRINGTGLLDCKNLVTQNCNLLQQSLATAQVNVQKKLEMRFNSRGKVMYWGAPDSVIVYGTYQESQLIPAEP